jgi:hypothetical protein
MHLFEGLGENPILQAQHPALADGLSRACALLQDGRLFVEDSGREAMARPGITSTARASAPPVCTAMNLANTDWVCDSISGPLAPQGI